MEGWPMQSYGEQAREQFTKMWLLNYVPAHGRQEKMSYAVQLLSFSFPKRRLLPLDSSSLCQSKRRTKMVWGWDAAAKAGELSLYSQAASVEREKCLFLTL